MLKIQLNNSNHRRIEFTEKSSQSHLFCEIIFVIGFFITIKSPKSIPKITDKIAEIKLNFIVIPKL